MKKSKNDSVFVLYVVELCSYIVHEFTEGDGAFHSVTDAPVVTEKSANEIKFSFSFSTNISEQALLSEHHQTRQTQNKIRLCLFSGLQYLHCSNNHICFPLTNTFGSVGTLF